jgi:hypothetical protein
MRLKRATPRRLLRLRRREALRARRKAFRARVLRERMEAAGGAVGVDVGVDAGASRAAMIVPELIRERRLRARRVRRMSLPSPHSKWMERLLPKLQARGVNPRRRVLGGRTLVVAIRLDVRSGDEVDATATVVIVDGGRRVALRRRPRFTA